MADYTVAVGAIIQGVAARSDSATLPPGTTTVLPYFVNRKGPVTTALAAVTVATTSAQIDMLSYSRALIYVVISGTTPVATIQVKGSPVSGGAPAATYLQGVDSNCYKVLTASQEYLVESLNNYI